jgi:DegV family protein with EDD domain
MFAQAFAPHVQAGDAIVCIVLSSKLSGTINAALAAAEQFPSASIHVVDSQSVAGGLRMQALQASRMAKDGAEVPEILTTLVDARLSQRLYACIPDLSHAVRTGRIGKAQAAIGSLMKIVPVISLRDGAVVVDAQVRTMARARQTMLDLSLEDITDPQNARFLVMHTNAPQLAESVLADLRGRLGGAQPKTLEVIEAGPVIAVHGGAGAVGVFAAQDRS